VPLKNEEKIKYQNTWLLKRKLRAWEYLGGKCVVCGYNDDLEFHHVDPSTKLFNIGSKLSMAWDKLILELDKCVLLCYDCHKKESIKVLKKIYPCPDVRNYNNKSCDCQGCRTLATRIANNNKRLRNGL
jgi:5-methylcytosine-specific restriction endonuclease McrA